MQPTRPQPGLISARSGLALLLVIAVSLCLSPVHAQIAAGVTVSGAPRLLMVEIVEGEGALNDIRQRTSREPIVQVTDENHKPVSGALVIFAVQSGGKQLPATFSGMPSITARTGLDGRAVGRGYRVTHKTGNFQVSVEVVAGKIVARALIHQTNYARFGAVGAATAAVAANKLLVGILVATAGIGAATAVTVVQSTSSVPTAITTGTGGVGAPAIRLTPQLRTTSGAPPR